MTVGARTACLILLASIACAGCDSGEDARIAGADATELPPPTYVGNASCAECHVAELELWRGSDHDKAMQAASAATVLADFDDASFTHEGVTTRFLVRDGEYRVVTDGPDGALDEYRVTHTIGVYPLQQYLIEFPGGRLQALGIAWDTRPSDQGGQRWFHLYPDERIGSDDPLHWTGLYQRWNTMCAECHSTDLVKNYDSANDRFDTVFASINVGCEGCHGPGSRHAADPSVPPPALAPVERAWAYADGADIARRQGSATGAEEVEVCAQCHARRSQLGDAYAPGQALLDGYRPALLDEGLYHADGQIREEVYVYGSFVQSAMFAAGVTCSDCHEPHSTRLRAEGNAVCGQCHLAGTYDSPAHHRHAAGSACVACHMRSETFMVVDPRRDHSFRVPRPDLTTRLDSPNACNDCHSDETAEWAAAQVGAWYPQGRQTTFHYGEALHAARTWSTDGSMLLRRVLDDAEQPAIARATALSLIGGRVDDALIGSIDRSMDDDDALVQLAAIEALENLPPSLRVDRGQRFLTAPLLAQRIAAAHALLDAREQLSERRQRDLDAALVEYLDVQDFNSDRGQGLFNAASVAAALGRDDDAIRGYRTAIERDPVFTPSYVNLADLYRNAGRESDAEAVLLEGLDVNPNDAGLDLALGLSLVRSGRLEEALPRLAAAVTDAPASPYYAYVYGVALSSAGNEARALEVLGAARERFPGYPDILFALATMLRDAGETGEALETAEALVALAPADQAARALVAELTAAGAR